jgi:DNA-binding response OmpR family regulator
MILRPVRLISEELPFLAMQQVVQPSDVPFRCRAGGEGWKLNLRLARLKAPGGSSRPISGGESGLLRAFLATPQRILTREQLLGLTRINGAEVYDRAVDVQVARLRRRVEAESSRPRFIKTERGTGYCFDASVRVVH